MTINVNLKPGTARKSARKMPEMPAFGSLSERFKAPTFDRMMTFIIASWIIGPALIGLMFFTQSSRKSDLDTSIAAEVADSTKYAQLIEANRTLLARRDTIAMKVNVIQEIDAGRYVWPHIMDELSRALPPFTWLTKVNFVSVPDSTEKLPRFKIEGRAQNNFALSQYMQQLENSPFVRQVRLLSNELVREREKLVYAFGLEASYENPPPDIIETVPLFAKEPD
jgi:Tfp pilus assembly protein PilN